MAWVHMKNVQLLLLWHLEGLFHIYNKTVNGENSFKVPTEDSLHLVEAFRQFSSFKYLHLGLFAIVYILMGALMANLHIGI